jgi:DNA-binding CsgD family transcriptional regulator
MKCFKNNSENFTTNKNNQNRITNHFLTNREVEVLQLICDQKTTVEKFLY